MFDFKKVKQKPKVTEEFKFKLSTRKNFLTTEILTSQSELSPKPEDHLHQQLGGWTPFYRLRLQW